MARYFTQGTFTTETNYAKAIRIAMYTGFTAAIAAGKSTWSIADHSYVNGTFERTVFNCSTGTGFSIMVGNHNAAGTQTFNSYLGKSYNATTHVLDKLGFGMTINTAAASDGYSSATLNPTAVGTSSTNPSPHSSANYVTIPATISNWFLVVEDDYAVFSIKDGTAGIGTVWYFGAFETAVTNTSLTDSAPYTLTQNGTAGGAESVILHSLNNQSKTIGHGGTILPATPAGIVGRPSAATIYDVYKTGTKSVLSKIKIFRANNDVKVVANPNTDGHHRGNLKGVTYTSPTGAAWGDQIDVNGTTYLYAGGIASTAGTSGAATNMAWWVAIN